MQVDFLKGDCHFYLLCLYPQTQCVYFWDHCHCLGDGDLTLVVLFSRTVKFSKLRYNYIPTAYFSVIIAQIVQ